MIKTIKLYDDQPYEREFTAKIIDIADAGEGFLDIVLDRTLFFPEEGGQTCDNGYICDFKVAHVSIDDGVITHRIQCAATALSEGEEVQGRIDWEHRFSNMQNHSAEHILSGLLHNIWGSENVGFHLSDNVVTLDTSKELEADEIKRLEKSANKVIYDNIPVDCRYYEPSELSAIEYRSKKELKEDVRLVTIPGVDVCACCAPHVSRTGEIGIIKIIKAIRYKGGMRFTVLAGCRAYDHITALQDMTDNVSHLLSVSSDKLDEAVSRLMKENEEYKIKLKNAAAAKLGQEIKALSKDSRNAVLFTDPIDNIVQRNAVNDLARSHAGVCAVFSSDGAGGYNYIISYPEGDVRDIAKLMKEKLTSKGGGSKDMIQGNVKASEEEIRRVLDFQNE